MSKETSNEEAGGSSDFKNLKPMENPLYLDTQGLPGWRKLYMTPQSSIEQETFVNALIPDFMLLTSSPKCVHVAIVLSKSDLESEKVASRISNIIEQLTTTNGSRIEISITTHDIQAVKSDSVIRADIHESTLQIIILSTKLTQYLADESNSKQWLRAFSPPRVVAIQIAEEIPNLGSCFAQSANNWRIINLLPDKESEFLQTFTKCVTDICNWKWRSCHSKFSIMPHVLQKEETKLVILFDDAIGDSASLQFEFRNKNIKVVISQPVLRNPYTAVVQVPEFPGVHGDMYIELVVIFNKAYMGRRFFKRETQSRKTLRLGIMDDDIARISKCLPPFLCWLDELLSKSIADNAKIGIDYKTDPNFEIVTRTILNKLDVIPTILHFTSYYGLPKTAYVILDQPGAISMCKTVNALEETPYHLAENKSNAEVAITISEFLQIFAIGVKDSKSTENAESTREGFSKSDTKHHYENETQPPTDYTDLLMNSGSDETTSTHETVGILKSMRGLYYKAVTLSKPKRNSKSKESDQMENSPSTNSPSTTTRL